MTRSKRLGLIALVTIALLPSCSLVGSCSEDDLRLAEAIPHYGAAQLEFVDDPESGGCAAQLEVEAEADDVIDHYRSALEADGWDVATEDVGVQGLEGMSVRDFSASRGEAKVTIALEGFEGLVSGVIRVDAVE